MVSTYNRKKKKEIYRYIYIGQEREEISSPNVNYSYKGSGHSQISVHMWNIYHAVTGIQLIVWSNYVEGTINLVTGTCQ